MKLFWLIILSLPINVLAQDAANEHTVPLTASVVENPASITLNWTENTALGTSYFIYRKIKGQTGWGSSIGSVSVGTTSFTDNTPVVGESYEYLVQKISGGNLKSWGYINAGIKTELEANRGDILVLVDSTFITSLATELDQLIDDLYKDAWMPKMIGVNPTSSVVDVKNTIQTEYNTLNNLTTVFLFGHIPVPYSGNFNPDAHPDHEGAWPADTYYGDLDGSWTDVTVNNTVASDLRNDNIPSDGKFDQSKTPSSLELAVCRVDFNDLPVFSQTEEDLLKNYLIKAHEFKVGAYVPQEKALYDQGGFTGMAEGFAQNGIRNFVPFVGDANLTETDYFSALTTESYLWSYGCGAGSYTSAGGLDNGTTLTSAELAATDMQASFTMLFGSYFGDWDKTNNLLRTTLANGKTLAASWAGRPNWHYHTMAQGDHLGSAAKMSMDVGTDYLSLTVGTGFVTGEGVHMVQLGDPSLRTYYVEPASNVSVTNINNEAVLNWTASTDASVDGYNIYRRTNTSLWTKVNTSIQTSTSYTDLTIPSGDQYEFMVKAVKLKTNSSGTFYNESLGASASATFSVGLEDVNDVKISIYPNPSKDIVQIIGSEEIQNIQLYSVTSEIIQSIEVNSTSYQMNISSLATGTYVLKVKTGSGTSVSQLIRLD